MAQVSLSDRLSIKDWQFGIGESPYTGFGQMVNVDIFSKPGCVQISNRLELDQGSVAIVNELIIWTAQDPRTGDEYAVDRQGTLYKRTTGGVWSIITGHGVSGALGQGLGLWNDYLFYARSNRLDVYGPLAGAPTWTNNWQNLNNADTHPILNAQDGHLYIGDAAAVSQVFKIGTIAFNPANGATYSWNSPQLTLNANYVVSTLDDNNGIGVSIGTKYGINGIFNIADNFFWDGASDSYTTPGTTHFAEDGVQVSKNVGGIYFTIAGTGTPRMFKSITSQAAEARRLNNVGVGTVSLFANAVDQRDGEVLFGIGQSLGAGGLNPMGVYSFRGNDGLQYVTRFLISTGRDGSNGTLLIGTVKLINAEQLLVSWYDNKESSSFGVDILNLNRFYSNYSAYIESPLYTVGTTADPTTYEQVEVRMGKKLVLGQGVRIKARRSLDDVYVTVATFDTAYVGRDYFRIKAGNISEFVNFQVRVELTTGSEDNNTPELKEIIFTA